MEEYQSKCSPDVKQTQAVRYFSFQGFALTRYPTLTESMMKKEIAMIGVEARRNLRRRGDVVSACASSYSEVLVKWQRLVQGFGALINVFHHRVLKRWCISAVCKSCVLGVVVRFRHASVSGLLASHL